MNQDNEDEGLEVGLLPNGMSFVTTGRPIDRIGFQQWVESLQAEMPRLLEEHNVCTMMSHAMDAMTERYLENKEDLVIPGYVVIASQVLTKLTRGALRFDNKVEVIPQVDHMIDLVGFCPTLTLYHSDDYNAYSPNSSSQPYLGRIKVVTLNELFY